MVNEKDAIEIISYAEKNGIPVFLDGGWGVDAALQKQTRKHDDIDLFIEKQNGEKFVFLLKQKGFTEIKKEYTTPAHTVWQDKKNRIVDLHLFEFDSEGAVLFESQSYPAEIFSWVGRIAGKEVRCIPPKEQVLFHLGYESDANDAHDVNLLCEHFHIPVPEEYSDIKKEMSSNRKNDRK